jgi:hypothetical protein
VQKNAAFPVLDVAFTNSIFDCSRDCMDMEFYATSHVAKLIVMPQAVRHLKLKGSEQEYGNQD